MPLKRILKGIYGSSLSRVYYIGNFTFTFKRRPARSPRLSAEHDPCAEHTVLIGKRACPAGAFRDVADGLKAHTVSLPLGGAKDAVFFLHRTVEWVFDLDEQQTRGVKIG